MGKLVFKFIIAHDIHVSFILNSMIIIMPLIFAYQLN